MENFKCKQCKETLPVSEFYRNKNCREGHEPKCKSCIRSSANDRYQMKSRTDPEWVFNERNRTRIAGNVARANGNDRQHPRKDIDKDCPKYGASKAAHALSRESGFHNHHWSYQEDHWKDTVKLRISDHYKIHRFTIYDSERLQYRTIHGVLLDTRASAEHYYSKVLSIRDGVYSELEKLK